MTRLLFVLVAFVAFSNVVLSSPASQIASDLRDLERDISAEKSRLHLESNGSEDSFLGVDRRRKSGGESGDASSFNPSFYYKTTFKSGMKGLVSPGKGEKSEDAEMGIDTPHCCCRMCGTESQLRTRQKSNAKAFKVVQPFRVSCAEVCSSGKFKALSGGEIRKDSEFSWKSPEEHNVVRGGRMESLYCAESEYSGCSAEIPESSLIMPNKSQLEAMTSVENLKNSKACGTSKRCLFVTVSGSFIADFVKVSIQRSSLMSKVGKFASKLGSLGAIAKNWGDTQHLYKHDTAIFPIDEDDDDTIHISVTARSYSKGDFHAGFGDMFCDVSTVSGKGSECRKLFKYKEGQKFGVTTSRRNSIAITTFAV